MNREQLKREMDKYVEMTMQSHPYLLKNKEDVIPYMFIAYLPDEDRIYGYGLYWGDVNGDEFWGNKFVNNKISDFYKIYPKNRYHFCDEVDEAGTPVAHYTYDDSGETGEGDYPINRTFSKRDTQGNLMQLNYVYNGDEDLPIDLVEKSKEVGKGLKLLGWGDKPYGRILEYMFYLDEKIT